MTHDAAHAPPKLRAPRDSITRRAPQPWADAARDAAWRSDPQRGGQLGPVVPAGSFHPPFLGYAEAIRAAGAQAAP